MFRKEFIIFLFISLGQLAFCQEASMQRFHYFESDIFSLEDESFSFPVSLGNRRFLTLGLRDFAPTGVNGENLSGLLRVTITLTNTYSNWHLTRSDEDFIYYWDFAVDHGAECHKFGTNYLRHKSVRLAIPYGYDYEKAIMTIEVVEPLSMDCENFRFFLAKRRYWTYRPALRYQ